MILARGNEVARAAAGHRFHEQAADPRPSRRSDGERLVDVPPNRR
jgi:hypothetical protein